MARARASGSRRCAPRRRSADSARAMASKKAGKEATVDDDMTTVVQLLEYLKDAKGKEATPEERHVQMHGSGTRAAYFNPVGTHKKKIPVCELWRV